MTTTWTDIASTDVDTDSPLDTDLFTALRDNANAVRQSVFAVSIAETSTASTSYVTLHSFRLAIPNLADYTTIQRLVTGDLQMKIANAAAIASVHLRDNATSTTGSDVTTSSTTYIYAAPTLDIDASWKGTTRTIDVRVKTNGSSYAASIKYDQGVGWRLDY